MRDGSISFSGQRKQMEPAWGNSALIHVFVFLSGTLLTNTQPTSLASSCQLGGSGTRAPFCSSLGPMLSICSELDSQLQRGDISSGSPMQKK